MFLLLIILSVIISYRIGRMHLFWENTKSENVTFNRILLTHKDLNLLNYNPTQIFP